MICRKIFISGRVQGVFFRESTRQMAAELSLSGYVRNLSDGRVEVLVAGTEKNVKSLIKWLKIGPKLAKVTTIEVVDLPPEALSKQLNTGFDVWATK